MPNSMIDDYPTTVTEKPDPPYLLSQPPSNQLRNSISELQNIGRYDISEENFGNSLESDANTTVLHECIVGSTKTEHSPSAENVSSPTELYFDAREHSFDSPTNYYLTSPDDTITHKSGSNSNCIKGFWDNCSGGSFLDDSPELNSPPLKHPFKLYPSDDGFSPLDSPSADTSIAQTLSKFDCMLSPTRSPTEDDLLDREHGFFRSGKVHLYSEAPRCKRVMELQLDAALEKDNSIHRVCDAYIGSKLKGSSDKLDMSLSIL